jgi:hypothetical protein
VVAPETINPHISLLAMAGVRTSETTQVHIQLGDASLLVLIDSGSTHNFVSEEAVARTSLQLLPHGTMKVTTANREHVSCPGMYRTTAFSIDGETFSTDFFALPLAGYDVVLSTHWSASLGPILWDFSALTMSFWHRDHSVCCQGVAGPASLALRACSDANLLPAMLDEFSTVFAEPTGIPPPCSRDHCIT